MTKMTKAEAQRAWNRKEKAAKFLGMMDETSLLVSALESVTFGDMEEIESEDVRALWETIGEVKKAGSVQQFQLIRRSETAKKVIAAKLREMADALDIV